LAAGCARWPMAVTAERAGKAATGVAASSMARAWGFGTSLGFWLERLAVPSGRRLGENVSMCLFHLGPGRTRRTHARMHGLFGPPHFRPNLRPKWVHADSFE
jgi:hypothetical protein